MIKMQMKEPYHSIVVRKRVEKKIKFTDGLRIIEYNLELTDEDIILQLQENSSFTHCNRDEFIFWIPAKGLTNESETEWIKNEKILRVFEEAKKQIKEDEVAIWLNIYLQ